MIACLALHAVDCACCQLYAGSLWSVELCYRYVEKAKRSCSPVFQALAFPLSSMVQRNDHSIIAAPIILHHLGRWWWITRSRSERCPQMLRTHSSCNIWRIFKDKSSQQIILRRTISRHLGDQTREVEISKYPTGYLCLTAMSEEVPIYTIIQADGLYPGDDEYENKLFAPREGQNYKLNYLQVDLYPVGAPTPKPWSDIPEEIRNQVDGIEVLKMGFTGEDAALFPRLKV